MNGSPVYGYAQHKKNVREHNMKSKPMKVKKIPRQSDDLRHVKHYNHYDAIKTRLNLMNK